MTAYIAAMVLARAEVGDSLEPRATVISVITVAISDAAIRRGVALEMIDSDFVGGVAVQVGAGARIWLFPFLLLRHVEAL